MELASRTRTTFRKEDPTYVNSGTPEGSQWGQPSVSYYTLVVINGKLYGQPISDVYFQPQREAGVEVLDYELAAEFEAWEAASDEALADFETELD